MHARQPSVDSSPDVQPIFRLDSESRIIPPSFRNPRLFSRIGPESADVGRIHAKLAEICRTKLGRRLTHVGQVSAEIGAAWAEFGQRWPGSAPDLGRCWSKSGHILTNSDRLWPSLAQNPDSALTSPSEGRLLATSASNGLIAIPQIITTRGRKLSNTAQGEGTRMSPIGGKHRCADV